MAEDEETTTARDVASNISTQLIENAVRDDRHDGGRSG
jgi:hypothetical protein